MECIVKNLKLDSKYIHRHQTGYAYPTYTPACFMFYIGGQAYERSINRKVYISYIGYTLKVILSDEMRT